MKLDAFLGCLRPTFCRQLYGPHYCLDTMEHVIMEIEVSGLSTLQYVLVQYNLYVSFMPVSGKTIVWCSIVVYVERYKSKRLEIGCMEYSLYVCLSMAQHMKLACCIRSQCAQHVCGLAIILHFSSTFIGFAR